MQSRVVKVLGFSALFFAIVLGVAADQSVAQGIDMTGFVDSYYGWKFNEQPAAFRNFDGNHNSFSFALAEVALEKKPTEDNKVGFRADLNFGPVADTVGAAGGASETFKHVQQAYVSSMTGKVQWDLGKFVT